jgi:hypothetical protein
VNVVLRRRCPDPGTADALRAAVAADNPEYVTVVRDGADLVIRVTTASPASARLTLEDLLACLSAAERAIAVAAAEPPGRPGPSEPPTGAPGAK